MQICPMAETLQSPAHDSPNQGQAHVMQQQSDPAPLWDEGISSFLHGEYDALGAPLTLEQLQGYAAEHAVRIGDILETLFLMAIYGSWRYTNADGVAQELDEEALNALYARGRLSDDDLDTFRGVWQPR